MDDTFGLVASIGLILVVFVGIPLLIVWLMDRPGAAGTAVRAVFGLLATVFGLAIIGWIVWNVISPSEHFPQPLAKLLRFGTPIGIVFLVWAAFNFFFPTRYFPHTLVRSLVDTPLAMLRVGWYWLAGARGGIERQDIDFTAPELAAATEEARRTLPRFIAEVTGHVDGAFIKFPFKTDQGVTEHVWAYVHHYEAGTFNVSLVNVPYTQKGEYEIRMDVPEADVEDWQIMLPDGRIKGAYSYIGAFRYLENRGVRFNRTMVRQRSQLIDAQLTHAG